MLRIFKAITIAFLASTFFSISYAIPHQIDYLDLKKPIQKQIDCLTENIYFEAGYESYNGKLAVAFVTLNRLASWTCQPIFTKKRLTIQHESLYNDIRELAIYVLINYHNLKDVTKGATYFHADYVDPQWGLPRTIKIGRHIFYKRHTDVQNINRGNLMVNCLYFNKESFLCEAIIAPAVDK